MNFVLSRFGSRNRSRPCSGKLFTVRLDSYSSGATDRLIQLNIDTILNELNQLLNTSANTADDRMAGKRCLLSLSNLIRDNPDCIYVQRAEQAVLAARSLSAFDGEGAFRAVLEHLEIGIWSSQNEGWSHIEILDFLKSIKNLDTTAVSCVLVALIWPLIRASESLDAENLGFVIHVVSSLGISHPALSAAILSRACTLISEMSIGSLCQILIATEGHDNSKLINAMHEKLSATVDTVSAQTLSQCYSVLHKQPLSTEGGAPTALLERMHLRACKVVEEANLDDIVELLRQSSRVQSKTMFSVTVEKALARVVKQKNNLLPEHITSLSQSLHTHNLVNEEMLAAVAERACRVVALFQPEQMAIVLNVFSSFNLYDPELFPLFALRLQHMTRQKILVDSDHVAVMIDSFARLQEKNEPLLYSAVAQLKVGMPTISPEIAKKCLDAFRTLNFNHEIVSALENRLVTHAQQ